MPGVGLLGVLAFAAIFIATNVIKVLKEYEKGVVFTLGRVGRKAAGPGLVILVPIIQQMRKVDMRTLVHDVPTQDVISQDNVSVKGERGHLLPRCRCGARGRTGRELYGGD